MSVDSSSIWATRLMLEKFSPNMYFGWKYGCERLLFWNWKATLFGRKPPEISYFFTIKTVPTICIKPRMCPQRFELQPVPKNVPFNVFKNKVYCKTLALTFKPYLILAKDSHQTCNLGKNIMHEKLFGKVMTSNPYFEKNSIKFYGFSNKRI